MSYVEMDEAPAFERVRVVDDRILPSETGAPRWSNEADPPAVGTGIVVTMNGCGPATVTGYFIQDGFLGLRCDLTDPPEWHRRQNDGNPSGHVFGAEFRLP